MGIYRVSGASSEVQRLKKAFETSMYMAAKTLTVAKLLVRSWQRKITFDVYRKAHIFAFA